MLGSTCHVPKEPCPSVSSPKKVSLLSLGGFGSRCLQGYLGRSGPWSIGNSGHARAVDTANATGNPRLTLCGQTSFGRVLVWSDLIRSSKITLPGRGGAVSSAYNAHTCIQKIPYNIKEKKRGRVLRMTPARWQDASCVGVPLFDPSGCGRNRRRERAYRPQSRGRL